MNYNAESLQREMEDEAGQEPSLGDSGDHQSEGVLRRRQFPVLDMHLSVGAQGVTEVQDRLSPTPWITHK